MLPTFADNGYEIIRGALAPQTCELLATEFQMLKDTEYYLKDKPADAYQGDAQTVRSYRCYAPLCFESLLLVLKPQVEQIAQRQLLPAYSYARIYYQGAVLPRHVDRPSCEISATVCIENDQNPWPIWLTDLQNNTSAVLLYPGDLIVYQGNLLTHWRDAYEETRQIQAFVHYVDADGDFQDFVYDRRPMLGLPATTRK